MIRFIQGKKKQVLFDDKGVYHWGDDGAYLQGYGMYEENHHSALPVVGQECCSEQCCLVDYCRASKPKFKHQPFWKVIGNT